MKPGDLIRCRTPKVKRQRPTGILMIYDCNTREFHPWKHGNLGMIIDIDPKTEGVIVMADGNVGWVSLSAVEVINEVGG